MVWGKGKKDKQKMSGGGGGFFWCLGVIGALVYYWSDITSFWMFFVVLFKSIFWPAYLIYYLHDFLNL